MSENSVGISTKNSDTWIAAFGASEQVGGHTRQIQLISAIAGKIQAGINSSSRFVSSNDAYDVTTISGNILAGDNSFLATYITHLSSTGTCLITPLLCDSTGTVIGSLDSKQSAVRAPITNSSSYISPCLSWKMLETGAWYIYIHVSGLSSGNSVNVTGYTF